MRTKNPTIVNDLRASGYHVTETGKAIRQTFREMEIKVHFFLSIIVVSKLSRLNRIPIPLNSAQFATMVCGQRFQTIVLYF